TDAVLPALIKISSERKGSSVFFDPERTVGIILGETEDGKRRWGSNRTDAFQQLFSETGIHFRVTDVILSEIWAKFRLNVTKNLPQAVLGCGLGAYDDSEHIRFIMEKLGQEVDCIAAAKGIDISLAAPGSSAAGKPLKTARFSTLQDLDAKRHTEIDMFSGAVVSMGRALSVPTPYNEMMLHLIKAIEEKNDGKFEY
ncbi:MAG: ketopantoate reductase family protein, partial [Anaerovoracaceae bacterium]